MTDMTNLADRYIAMWNETDAKRRRQIIAELWSETGSYVDPLMSAEGPAAIDAMVAAVQARFPSHSFRRTGKVDGHNRHIRFAWQLGPSDSTEASIAGIDIGVVAADGRLQSITGFLDRMPAAKAA